MERKGNPETASPRLPPPRITLCAPSGLHFLLIGAAPSTRWLAESGIALDGKGFVLTGDAAARSRRFLETSRRGVFAIGVRSGSIKRVAAAVGDGAQAVAAVHAYLAELGRAQSVIAAR